MKPFATFALAAFGSLMVGSAAQADNTLLTNPASTAYVNSTTNVAAYGQPTGMLIPGPCNLYDASFAAARSHGAEILAYVGATSMPDNVNGCAPAQELHGADIGPNLWPYPTYGFRSNYPNTHIADIQVGSAWADHVVEYVEKLMTEDKVDGVFLDATGARNWSASAAWATWPQAEKDKYTLGTIDLVRRIDAKRRAINPRFIVVNNGNWDRGNLDDGSPDPLKHDGEPYVDGICIEGHRATEPFHIGTAGFAYGNLGHRRVIAIAQDPADAQLWENVQGITHVFDPQPDYLTASPPVIPFHRLTDRAKKFGKTSPGTGWSAGMSTDAKRASKFTLSENGRLVALHAYLDGLGGGAGSQPIRLVLYRDNGGVPGTKVVESSAKSLAAGTAATWQRFTATNVVLTAGTYWIAVQSGTPAQIVRASQAAPANYYANSDVYSDGATDPFGTGNTGGVTLSLYVSYTVGP